MALTDVNLLRDEDPIPADVRAFLREADRRIDEFQQHARVPGFVASDFPSVYRLLRALASANLPGNLFCEWGSGFGVVACLAAMLDFDAVGIEIEGDLVDAAQKLADDFELPVEFIRGSFIPKGGSIYADVRGGYAWLHTEEAPTNDELGFDADDFDVIFAYPWPDEEGATEKLFDRYARTGALLVTYHGGDDLRLRRKVGKKKR
jgi:SAM-dependent methyltransferase